MILNGKFVHVKMKKLFYIFCILFLLSCKKEVIVFKQFSSLPFTCIDKQLVNYTIISWPSINSMAGDTIFWEYDNLHEIKGAKQNNQSILNIVSKRVVSDSTFIEVKSVTDSAIITLFKNKPVQALVFNAVNSNVKEYQFEYDVNNQLGYYSYKENSNLAPSKYWFNSAGLDSAAFYGGISSAPATFNFTQFSYKYNVNNVPFLPFVLSVPNQAKSFVFGKPICENVLEAYLWGLISPYTSQKLLESYQLETNSNLELIKANIHCDSRTLTYEINNIKIINSFQ